MINPRKILFDVLKSTVMKKAKSNMNNNMTDDADNIVRTHVILSMGAGFIPLLLVDIFAVTALQLDMIRQLCRVYGVDYSETRGKAIVTSLTGSTLARMGARGAGSFLKLIPVIGPMLGGVTVSVFSGASTYALGEVFKMHFENGGTILDFDSERFTRKYKEKFEKGKRFAKEVRDEEVAKEEAMKEEKSSSFTMKEKATKMADEVVETVEIVEDVEAVETVETVAKVDVFKKLRELGDLKEAGILTEDEFEQMKKKLIDEF